MTSLASTLPVTIAALGRALARGGTCALDTDVPAALWRRALVQPAAEFLVRPGKSWRTAIARAGAALAGGAPAELVVRVATAIELVHGGSLIVDDVEDEAHERRGAPALHRLIGAPLAINTGTWMYFWALAELAELELPGAVELAVRSLVRCHQGQALDLAVRVTEMTREDTPRVVAAITRLKTGALCRLAGELGALAAGGSPDTVAAIAGFAESAGIALQMLDDLGSFACAARRAKGREDLAAARATWPWAWLAELDPPERANAIEAARAVAAGHVDIADALAIEIAGATAELGRARIRAALDRALADLRGALGDHPAIATIAADLSRMEASYV
ncbi:MAG TPA: polyprenyl synthetase family protein [Kofleriaceae bacterium]|nr:polyprenyl synthetase family protein [Kofleriaceae bacterium]